MAGRESPVYEEGGAASGAPVLREVEEGCEREVVCGGGEREEEAE